MKSLVNIFDFEIDEINEVFSKVRELKKLSPSNNYAPLKGKTLGMIFKKSSTRTRISFEVGMYQLGGKALFLDHKDLQWKRGESLSDSAKVLSIYLDGIVIRTYSHKEVEDLANAADVPVINGLSDLLHPCQILTDIFTIQEHVDDLKKIRIVYLGDGNNVANSWINGAARMGLDLRIVCPENYLPDYNILKIAREETGKTNGKIELFHDPQDGVSGADVIYTDVWVSMGQEEEAVKKKEAFKAFQLNSDLVKKSGKDPLIMHCLPAHRGEEITSEVMDGPQSIIYKQAENRLHVQKAILEYLLEN
ncbi:MAG: ornithine carbamoyltransferase [Nitrospinota bacterium]|jgi:ornithine carbamoyltransferase|nr:ornithine carbamoyltransferase [Nitrospinota bacterium]MDP7580244.1 ornithine carbamoyltransferase [Nitrospinota bacterium]HJN02982.1 ornithine carbamoyltransferase [Nitrospinota bacterium]